MAAKCNNTYFNSLFRYSLEEEREREREKESLCVMYHTVYSVIKLSKNSKLN